MKNELFSIGPVTIYGYGLMVAIAIIAAYVLSEYRAKKKGLDYEHVFTLAIWCLIGGTLGSKLLYFITIWKEIMKNPAIILDFQNGFVVYGGIIGGIIGGFFYCRYKKWNFWEYFDLAMPQMALAQGIGRIGCFLAGCCYGRETDAWFGVVFPEGSMAPAGVSLIPTQLISSAGDFLIVAVLVLFYKKRKHVGDVGALYMLLYGVGRFLVEILRQDDRGGIGLLSTSQIISIVIVAGSFLLFARNRRHAAA